MVMMALQTVPFMHAGSRGPNQKYRQTNKQTPIGRGILNVNTASFVHVGNPLAFLIS